MNNNIDEILNSFKNGEICLEEAKNRLESNTKKLESKLYDNSKVNRFEVIDEEGRRYVKYNMKNIEFSYQDEGQTLKIFINSDKKLDN